MNLCHSFCAGNSSRNLTVGNAFDCIGKFSYKNSICGNATCEISTSASKFIVNDLLLKVVPGKEFKLSLAIEDDFSHEVPATYQVDVKRFGNSVIDID